MSIFSESAILKELEYNLKTTPNIEDFLETANSLLASLSEAQYDKVTQKLKLSILDIERFVKVNNCQVISNPRAFAKANIPSDDGLLSYTIFGISKEERSGIYAYIDLHGWFIDPSCYKTWTRLDKNVKSCIHGIDTFIINEKGELVQDPNGKCGIEFLRKNLDKIKFKSNESIKRDISVKYLDANRNNMFIKKYLVIPAYYRDKNTSGSSNRIVGLSGINKLYSDLIIASNALTATQDYMFDATDAMNGRVQEIILNIYNWFTGAQSANIQEKNASGIQGKFGILKRANQTKTSNYSSRLVISAPELKASNPEAVKVNFDYTAIPLSACLADFKDFIIFHARRFFDNQFMGIETFPVIDKTGKVVYKELDSPQIYFSDERINQEMERFLHGYINRFVPIEVPVKNEGNEKYYMQFKGRYGDVPPTNPEVIYNRRLTWCDILFIAAVEATKDKHVLITRFPIDAYTNQFATKIFVSSTRETEPMTIENEYYPNYPKIREEDIGMDTSNRFIDTLTFSNLYLPGIGGDYDGDQVTIKGVYTEEANEELEEFMNSKQNFINFGGKPSRKSEGDVIQSIYVFTKVLSDTNLKEEIQFN